MQTSIVPLNFCPRFCAALFVTCLSALQLGAAVGQDWERHNSSGAYAIHKGDYVYIGNLYLQRVFRTSGHILRTVALINKLSKAAPNYRESDEFEIEAAGKLQGELTAADFRLEDIAVSERPDETLRTVFTLRCIRDPALSAAVNIESYGERKFQRKWLNFNWNGGGDVIISRVDVEVIRLGWWNIGRVTHSGYGQPVFAGDMYLGLEYPGAETSDSWLRQFPGRSAKGGLQTKPAIWGVAPDAASVAHAFLNDYLPTIAKAPRPFVIYNLLGAGMPEQHLLEHWINVIGSEAKKAELHIDSFAIDDGWQDETTIWQIAPKLFPDGFATLAAKTASFRSRLGLWLSLHGFTLDTRWGARTGLEVVQVGDRGGAKHGRYCIAGPKYSAVLREQLDRYLREYDVNYFKFDYNQFGCDNASHGHPTGRAGRDAQLDAFIATLQHVKSIAPNTFIAITSGMWLSPWWTQYADAVWLGGNDQRIAEQYPGLSPHDLEITYRDSVMYDDLRNKQYAFPFSSVMTHGFWTNRGTPFSEFKDDAMMAIGRGITKWEILTSPEIMDAKRYEFLSRAIRWGKANWSILSDTQMILGDPSKGEIYGYVHCGDGATLLFLRNPSLQSRLIELPEKVIDARGNNAPGNVSPEVFEIYPAYSPLDRDDTSEIHVEILGTQTKCLAIVWDRKLAQRLRL